MTIDLDELTERHLVADLAREDLPIRVLEDDADTAGQPGDAFAGHVLLIVEDPALGRAQQAIGQPHERRLSAPVLADDRDRFPGLDDEVDLGQRARPVGVDEAHVVEAQPRHGASASATKSSCQPTRGMARRPRP